MIDDLVELAISTAVDVESARASHQHRWVRRLRMVVGGCAFALLAAGIYVTFKYT